MKKIVLGFVIFGLFFSFKIALAENDLNSNLVVASSSEPSTVKLLVLKRGNGVGTVSSPDVKIYCGDSCQNEFKLNEVVTLTAAPRADSVFKGWAGDCKVTSPEQCVVTMNDSKILTPRFELRDINTTPPVPAVDPTDRNVPRVMFWWGKVNQHWNLDKGVWETDADGISGAREDKLAYCKKFYPTTTKVVEYKNETINTWRDAYNKGQYISIKMSYRCILENETVSGEDVSSRPEVPNAGSVCYYFPNLDYCRPFSGSNPGVNPPAQVISTQAIDQNTKLITQTNTTIQPVIQPIRIEAVTPVNAITPVDTITTIKTEQSIPSVVGDKSIITPAEIKPLNSIDSEKIDLLSSNKINQLLEEINQLRNRVKEQENEIVYLKNLQKGVKAVSAEAKTSINNFITYGVDETTKDLGTKERAAAVTAYKAAFNKLPENQTELSDAVKIANGESPEKVSAIMENKAKAEFKKVYGYSANLSNPEEEGAIKIMAYGLRISGQSRNIEAEKVAIKNFVKVYKRLPKADWDWNIVRAVAYSGATK